MNRRSFIRASATSVAVLAFAPSLLMTGCAFSVTGMINTILNALQGILAVAEPNAPWLASLNQAIAALQNAETQWKNTGTVSIIEDALNTVAAVLAVIPVTAVYSPLIAVIVAGIEAILNYFAPPAASAKLTTNPYHGRVALDKPSFTHPTYQGAFKAQFDNLAKALGLTKAEIA